jgi:arsenate reductase
MKKKNKIYHLTNCGTCKKILGSLNTEVCELQDIKQISITEKELDDMAALAGSYEALFSRKAIKYKTLGLKDKKLTEKDYRKIDFK